MDQIDHFSHGHPLVLLGEEDEWYDPEEYHMYSADDIQNIDLICNGCLDPIAFSSRGVYYGCAINRECGYFLHKSCVELPRQISHPFHSEHDLILLTERETKGMFHYCVECRRDCNSFIYSCIECDYEMDIFCATKFNLKSHIHPLTRLPRSGLFLCDACDTKHEGTFYYCSTCSESSFFVHENCLSLPTKIKCEDHEDHSLTLAYSLPSQYSTFWNFCGICCKLLKEEKWMYYCWICRFLAHVNCASSKIEPFLTIIKPRQASKVTLQEAGDYVKDVIHFPVVDQSVTLISHLLSKVCITNYESCTSVNPEVAKIINHFSHEHPLLLVDVEDIINENGGSISSKLQMCLMNDTRVDEIICNACIRPISVTPFYKCSSTDCNFFLHKCCAELPKKIDKHHSHPEHPLILLPKSPDFFNLFECKGCLRYCNGFSYHCFTCNLYLDVVCGSLPKTIIYEFHHPTHLLSLKGKISDFCKSCFLTQKEPRMAYACECCDYEIDSWCVMLSHKVRHRYDDYHPFILTYDHVKGHTDEYICDLCEKPLDPKAWYYHCVECDRSVHTKCLRPFYCWSNIKFDMRRTLNISSHQHPLVLGPVIQEDTKVNNSLLVTQDSTECSTCYNTFRKDIYYFRSKFSFSFMCGQCCFNLCYDCANPSARESRTKEDSTTEEESSTAEDSTTEED